MTANRNRRRPITRPVFHHTTFATLKLDEMVEFYEAVAGLEPVYHGTDGAWLTNDEANHRIALLALPELKAAVDKGHTVGLHHTAFEYGDFHLWLDNYERLAEKGIRPFLNLDHGMTMSMYYQDPEGNGVEIQFDTFGSWKKSKEWMWASQEFSANPTPVMVGTVHPPLSSGTGSGSGAAASAGSWAVRRLRSSLSQVMK